MSRLLRETGEALYGPQWQTPLARELGMSDRHMRRLAAGTHDVPPGVWLDLMRIAMERAMTLDGLTERLRTAAAPGGPEQPIEPPLP